MAEQRKSEIRYLNAPSIDTKKKKYCRFKKSGIKYIDFYTHTFKFIKHALFYLPVFLTALHTTAGKFSPMPSAYNSD